MAEVKWIKLAVDIFDNRKIKQIERMPEGDALIVIWLKLLVLAGNVNDNGLVYFTREIPYTDQLLSTEFNRPQTVIQLALATFQRFGMIEIVEDVIHISNWEKYQNIDGLEKIREQNRIRQKNWYDRHKTLQLAERNVTPNVSITLHNATDIDKEKELDKDIEIEVDSKNNYKNTHTQNEDFITNDEAWRTSTKVRNAVAQRVVDAMRRNHLEHADYPIITDTISRCMMYGITPQEILDTAKKTDYVEFNLWFEKRRNERTTA